MTAVQRDTANQTKNDSKNFHEGFHPIKTVSHVKKWHLKNAEMRQTQMNLSHI